MNKINTQFDAYLIGVRTGVRDALVKSASNEYLASALLGGAAGGMVGGPLGSWYGEYVAGESPHYRDVLRKKLLFGILGALSGAALGAGAATGARSIMEHTGRLL